MRVDYVRVSRKDQRPEPQRDALLTDGCKRVFEERISSREAEKGALREVCDYCRKGDVLVVDRGSAVQDICLGCCTKAEHRSECSS